MAPPTPGPPADVPHVLREYSLIADGLRGALVGPRGEVSWMCFPEWDGDAVFSSLIGGGGHYQVRPEGRYVWGATTREARSCGGAAGSPNAASSNAARP